MPPLNIMVEVLVDTHYRLSLAVSTFIDFMESADFKIFTVKDSLVRLKKKKNISAYISYSLLIDE